MRFMVITGGRGGGHAGAGPLEQFQQECEACLRPELRQKKEIGCFRDSGKKQNALSRTDVAAEATRRIKASGYERCRIKQLATGEPIPRALQYLKIQIDWVADTLAGLDPIPADFADDKYWPR